MIEVFNLFDVDGSKSIDKEEACNHWKGKFGKLSAKELFNQVDVNNDGEVSLDEWVNFWEIVHQSGHDEAEINAELEGIKNGESWVGFNDLPKKKNLGKLVSTSYKE